MKNRYLIRLDDACPTMNRQLWHKIEIILDKYGVKPLVGIITHNEDPQQMIDSFDESFWEKVKAWQKKRWTIALHGYNHCYTSNVGLKGLNPMWERSEFSGLSLEEQKTKIRQGIEVMRGNGINPQFFFAPSHTFDENTLNALRDESDIRIISDTISNQPYKYKDFTIIPQLGGHCTEMKMSGIWTFCLHPNVMKEADFKNVENFLEQHSSSFISFDDIDYSSLKEKGLLGKVLSLLYFTYRKLRGVK